jgi:hypothetical protein
VAVAIFITIDSKYKTPFLIYRENSRKKPSQAIATNGCYQLALYPFCILHLFILGLTLFV